MNGVNETVELWERLPPLNEGHETYVLLLVRTENPRRIWDTFFIKTNNKGEIMSKLTYAYRKSVGLQSEILLDVTPKSISAGIEKFIHWYMDQKLKNGEYYNFTAVLSSCIRKSDVNSKKLNVYVSNNYEKEYADIAVVKYDEKYYHITSKKVEKNTREVPLPGFIYTRGMAELIR